MRVFVTGATGFVGLAVVEELLEAGHQVLGLCRSEEKAEVLAAAGAEVCRGSLEDPACLREAAAAADGVVHLAFNHDFSRFAESCEHDRRVIELLGSALEGSARPLVVTSGVLVAQAGQGRPAAESDAPLGVDIVPRAASEEAAAAVAANGGNVSIVRLSQVHDPVRYGLVSYAIGMYRDKGACAYVGDGLNAISAVHVRDAARLYRLALEKAEPGACYHAVAEEGVPMKAIVETIGRHLQLPVRSVAPGEAGDFFGWLATMIGRDGAASSARTRQALGWRPAGPGLLADLERGRF